MSVRFIKQVYHQLPVIFRLLLSIAALMLFFGTIIHLVEPKQFPTIFDGIWWAIVTGATVGYGDFVPLTIPGKMVAITLILSGGGLIAYYITTLSAATVQHEKDLVEGKLDFKGSNHSIFIGWNERTRRLIDLSIRNSPNTQIVLIDRTLRSVDYRTYPVHFIKGDPTEDQILKQANVSLAQRVLISADVSAKSERQADNDTILATVAVRGNNKHVLIIAEVLTRVQIENALRAGATTIIRSNDFMSGLFYHELSYTASSTPFEDILQLMRTQQFRHITVTEDQHDKTFAELVTYHVKQQHILLGVIRNREYYFNCSPTFAIQKGDILILLIAWKN
ncbi:potassium channel family protein [Oceanobacillus manasiensis]|uniref:potassium channel family protein n=1 Tax=Oceanobacillus manasiensis TaxID=586413 RepID=UPI0005A8244D|nr:potassium channel family protein [Oceanobacillus manasiensis]